MNFCLWCWKYQNAHEKMVSKGATDEPRGTTDRARCRSDAVSALMRRLSSWKAWNEQGGFVKNWLVLEWQLKFCCWGLNRTTKTGLGSTFYLPAGDFFKAYLQSTFVVPSQPVGNIWSPFTRVIRLNSRKLLCWKEKQISSPWCSRICRSHPRRKWRSWAVFCKRSCRAPGGPPRVARARVRCDVAAPGRWRVESPCEFADAISALSVFGEGCQRSLKLDGKCALTSPFGRWEDSQSGFRLPALE